MTLFVYFCGTNESTEIHRSHFMPTIDAEYHLYINGVGSAQVVHPNSKVIQIGNNSKRCNFFFQTKTIYCIEKIYAGNMLTGYRGDDAKKVAKYAYDALIDIIGQAPQITKIIFAGHSRGASVGLSSFLYYLLDQFKTKIRGNQLITETTKFCLFLDPVAGQSGNTYLLNHSIMPEQWSTQDLYPKLLNGNLNFHITEVWAREAPFDQPGVKVSTFNPARRFLCRQIVGANPQLCRMLLGYRHSSMINPDEDLNNRYENNPYDLLKSYINALIVRGNVNTFAVLNRIHNGGFNTADKQLRDFLPGNRLAISYKAPNDNLIQFETFINQYLPPL
jgi:hypothetical protein